MFKLLEHALTYDEYVDIFVSCLVGTIVVLDGSHTSVGAPVLLLYWLDLQGQLRLAFALVHQHLKPKKYLEPRTCQFVPWTLINMGMHQGGSLLFSIQPMKFLSFFLEYISNENDETVESRDAKKSSYHYQVQICEQNFEMFSKNGDSFFFKYCYSQI